MTNPAEWALKIVHSLEFELGTYWDPEYHEVIARALESTDKAAREEERESLCTEYIDDFIVGVGFMDNLVRMLWKEHDIDISGDEQDKMDTLANLAERAAAIRKGEQ